MAVSPMQHAKHNERVGETKKEQQKETTQQHTNRTHNKRKETKTKKEKHPWKWNSILGGWTRVLRGG